MQIKGSDGRKLSYGEIDEIYQTYFRSTLDSLHWETDCLLFGSQFKRVTSRGKWDLDIYIATLTGKGVDDAGMYLSMLMDMATKSEITKKYYAYLQSCFVGYHFRSKPTRALGRKIHQFFPETLEYRETWPVGISDIKPDETAVSLTFLKGKYTDQKIELCDGVVEGISPYRYEDRSRFIEILVDRGIAKRLPIME